MMGFVSGIYAATANPANPWSVLPWLILGVVIAEFILWRSKVVLRFMIAIGVGAGFLYAIGYSIVFNRNPSAVFDIPRNLTGIVLEVRQSPNSQRILFQTKASPSERLEILARKSPPLRYGDEILIEGKANPISEEKIIYAARHKLSGTINFPKITIQSHGGGNAIKRGLDELQTVVKNTLGKILPTKESSFIAGLLLGDTGGFSQNFRDAIRKAGVSHIVALSGYNITIIIQSVAVALLGLVSRRGVFVLTILVALGFVIMTGADASIIRAAIMALVVGLAAHAEKIYSPRNTIALTCCVMLLANPYLLLGDLGFQLSFLSLIGIFYLAPALRKIFYLGPNPGVWHWRENAINTIAAQAVVFPVLAASFKTVSLISILANVIILPLIPITMLLAVVTLAVYSLSAILGGLAGEFLSIITRAEINIIEFLSAHQGAIRVNSIGGVATVFYFTALLIIVFYGQKKTTGYERR